MNDPNGFRTEGRGEQRAPRGGGGLSTARGAALIAMAVLLGILLLNWIDDGSTTPVGAGGSSPSSKSTTATSGAGGSASTSPTTKAATIAPAAVTVLVLNGSGRNGVASTLTNSLKAQGYNTLAPSNASGVRTGTVINAKAGKDGACTALATLIPGAKVEAMPTPPPSTTDADCIVTIGA